MMEKKQAGIQSDGAGFPCRLVPEGDQLRIIADLPGVREESIRLDLDRRTLVVTVTNRSTRCRESIELPFPVRLRTRKFSGGVLEITLDRSEIDWVD